MRISTATIRDFRNLVSLDLELPAEGVVIIGGNGQGKTNLLEALYYPVLFRSFRGSRDRELVRFSEEGFFVAVATDRARVQAGYRAAGAVKRVRVDGTESERLGDAVGKVAAVALSPADREIVSGGPGGRRRYLDILLSLGRKGYLTALTTFRAALKQRNAALRRGRPEEVRAFDAPLAQAAAEVLRARRCWVESSRERYGTLCSMLGESGEATMEYRPRRDEPEPQDVIIGELERAMTRDLQSGNTSVGPHRHDLRLLLNSHDIRTYGSAGQQRTASLALRILEAEMIRTATDTVPVGLYDDVFVELDSERQQRLLTAIREVLPGQAVLTAPRESEVPGELIDLPRWRMEGGRIEV